MTKIVTFNICNVQISIFEYDQNNTQYNGDKKLFAKRWLKWVKLRQYWKQDLWKLPTNMAY